MRRGSSILNISSIHSIISTHNFSVYAATKGAVDALTRSLAVELADIGIRINAIRPGWIQVESDMVQSDSDVYRGFCERVPLHRVGTVEDIVPTAVLLCSDDSAYVTGQVWTIDGGHGTLMNTAFPKGHVDGGARSEDIGEKPSRPV